MNLNNDNFWRNELTWRSTNTGMNTNVIGEYVHKEDRQDIINYMRSIIESYKDGRYYLDNENKKDYFVDVVNDCLKNVYKNFRGFVFSDLQLKEVMKIVPSVNVKYSSKDECYYCWK
jgi:hypothetical protein